MSANGALQFAITLALLLALAVPLGLYCAAILDDAPTRLRWAAPLERLVQGALGPMSRREMSWSEYAYAVLAFSLLSVVALYAIQRLQGFWPLNPQSLPGVSADSAFNTAISFVTNTNWQGYGGETTMSHLTQMAGLTVQNFASAAVGMAVLAALARGLAREGAAHLGNFWLDLTRVVVYLLLPLSLVVAIVMVAQGVVQSFASPVTVTTLDGSSQAIPLGPVASQVAIKQLGTNGGGFFNANSAHPLENPTPLSNLIQLISILWIPAALCIAYGKWVRDLRQGLSLLAAMLVVLVPACWITVSLEQAGTPALAEAGAGLAPAPDSSGGNLEGKEVRFGITNSALWAVATTAASNGSVNAMLDSFTPLGGMVPLWLIQLGEVIFGGVGSGLYGMVLFAIVAVLLGGLMVGRTPEYLGKKIEPFEMKMAMIAILTPSLFVLLGTAVALAVEPGRAGIQDAGAHGFTEVLYALSSAANNNGSAFAGLSTNTPFYNTLLGLAMWFGRFFVMLPVLAIAGSLAAKRRVAAGASTLPTHTPLFIALLVGTVLLVGALTFVPALALGPIAEHLSALQTSRAP